MPELSIIIPTYNEENDIFSSLISLSEQSYKNFEIIIVDDGSTDRTLEIVEKFKEQNKISIKILKQLHGGPGKARNFGAKNAKGEILIFIDADMRFDKDYLKNLIEPILKTRGIGTTHELELVNNINNIWSRCWGRVRVSKEEAKDVKIFRAIRKKEFLELGGFEPKYGYADDQTLWFKYKIKPIVAKNTICYHKNPETLKQVFKQSRWIGASHDAGLIKFAMMIIFFPVLIPILSIRKSWKNKDFSIFPAMIIFMTARYFGNLAGYYRKIFCKENIK
ncbi:MAG: glycosyltransferase family A protein [Nanoarchaeota archaeon]|nr:glycosyltransferase family 2 protein [Nanoarchaeota archaeon]